VIAPVPPARFGRIRIALALAFSALATLVTIAAPASAEQPRPSPSAAAAILIDANDGDVLFGEDEDEQRPIASTTKLMTALLALERARPDDLFAAANYDALPVESTIGLRAGERMKVRDLLRGLLLASANDAAETIAQNVSGSRAAFVRSMNARARALGLKDTSFANPIGLDDPDNHSSARDLARLTARLLRDERFASIVGRTAAELSSGDRRRIVQNRNALVGRYDFVDGVKTGRTRGAGEVLIGSASRGGARVVSVVLGEPSRAARDADTLELLRYGLDQFTSKRVVTEGRTLARVPVQGNDERAPLAAVRNASVALRSGQRASTNVRAPRELRGPLPPDSRAGRVEVTVDGRVVRRVPLVTTAMVKGPDRSGAVLSGLLLTLLLLGCIVIVTLLTALRVRVLRRRRARSRRRVTSGTRTQ